MLMIDDVQDALSCITTEGLRHRETLGRRDIHALHSVIIELAVRQLNKLNITYPFVPYVLPTTIYNPVAEMSS